MLRHLAPPGRAIARGRCLATEVEALPAWLGHRADHSLPDTACLRGQVCGSSARTEWPVWGSRGTVLLEAADALVVPLAARRSWFCCHQLSAVLLQFERRRTGRAEMAAPGRALCWTRGCGC